MSVFIYSFSMVNLPLVDILHEWGLTEKEAQIYLACLSLGRASVGTIARKS